MAEKISTSMMPSQKSGTLMPKTTKLSVSVRVHRPPVAARMPSGTPTDNREQHGERGEFEGHRQALEQKFGERRVGDDILARDRRAAARPPS